MKIFQLPVTQDDNSSGGAYYIRLRDNDTDNITLGATDLYAFQITASGEGSSDAENVLGFSSVANDDRLVFGGSTVPTRVLGSNINLDGPLYLDSPNASFLFHLSYNGSERFRFNFSQFYSNVGGGGASLGRSDKYWGSLYSRNAYLKGHAATNVPLTIDAQAAQSANLTEWKASDGVVVAQVAPDGSIATSGNVNVSGVVTTDTINATGSTLDIQKGGNTVLKANGPFTYYYGGGGNRYILQGSDFFRPQGGGASPFDLGGIYWRWRNVYSEDGSFSGDLNVENSGSLKVFGVGDSHTNITNTEFIDIFHSGGHGYIVTDQTGTGGEQNLIIGQKSQFNLEIGQDNGIKFRFGTADRLSINQLCDVQPLGANKRLGTSGVKME